MVHGLLTFRLPLVCAAPLFLLNATVTDDQVLLWSSRIHLSVLVFTRDRDQRRPGEGQGGLLVCLYPTALEEDAHLALEELDRMALLQTLRQAMATEAGEGLGEAGEGILGLMGGCHSY